MNAIFLSASVPLVGRGTYHETANPFLIQCAVRELFMAVIRRYRVVWGGHPAITPIVWSICEDLSVDYSSSVILYQSRYFQDRYPEENDHFKNVIFTEAVPGDRDASLTKMRKTMLSAEPFFGAVFIGGMEGVEVEHSLFRELHPDAKVVPVPSPGGAALNLANEFYPSSAADIADVDFAGLFHRHFGTSAPSAIHPI